MSINLDASSVNINMMIIIDTDYVKNNYPNPSTDPDNPTGINHKSQYIICNSLRGIISGQGTADLNLKANVRDCISFSGTSIYGNSDDAIIIYGIKNFQEESVFQNFTTEYITIKQAVSPDPNSESNNGLPAKTYIGNFVFWGSKVKKLGKENFHIYFALYNLAKDGNTQELLGYYYWDPTVTVE